MYVNVYVPKSGGSVVPKSDVYKCSDPKDAYLVGREDHSLINKQVVERKEFPLSWPHKGTKGRKERRKEKVERNIDCSNFH